MKRAWWYRFTFLMILVVVSVVTIIPTVFDYSEDGNYPVKSKINLGLDLQGGLYMVLGIDFNKVFEDEIKNMARKMKDTLKDFEIDAKMGEVNKRDIGDPRHTIILKSVADVEKAKERIKEYYREVLRLTSEKKTILEYGLTTPWRTRVQDSSVTKSIEVIRNRIDEFGVTEPEIVSQGKERIIVQLPGVKDIARAKRLIGKTAKLEFKIVNDSVSPATVTSWIDRAEKAKIIYKKGQRFSDYLEKLNNFLKKDFPKGYELAFQKTVNKHTNELEGKVPFLVDINPRLSGDDLADATVRVDQQKNEPYVSLSFKSKGAKRFEDVTGKNVGKRMAVILDGNVYTAPSIRDKIVGGNAQITLGVGNFNKIMKQASDIAMVLRAGALPVKLDFLEQRIVGPSLGHDSIEKARYASIVGCLILFAFLLFYYRISGTIAIATLCLNIVFVLACLVGLEATLTLPGIAGIALTIGMAIDANIIIYERIREEKRKGLSNYKAVDSGFTSAFWTILDANITTALAGLCLLNFGTGPIRGFAVTLIIGIFATVYSSYFVGKIIFELYMNKVEGQDLSI